MPGAIVGVFGKQRSGKTLFAYKLCKSFLRQAAASGEKLRCYTNIYTKEPEFTYIKSISEIPLDLDEKIVFIDEIYNGCDAQDYRLLKEISIFVNTIGKQNCLFVFTSIDASMVYNRIRKQMSAAVFVRGDKRKIYYRMFNLDSGACRDFIIEKSPEFFKDVKYDTNFIPVVFDWSMKEWDKKLKQYYAAYYNL